MLRAKYKCGSSVILPTPRDIDVVYYYDNEEERRDALLHNHSHDIDNHYCLVEKATLIRMGCYAYPFMELIDGEEIEALKNFNFLEHKAEYAEKMKPYLSGMSKVDKRWYHLVIAYYMFKEEKTTLTKAQLKVAQNAHDKGISDDMYNKVVDYFNQIQ